MERLEEWFGYEPTMDTMDDEAKSHEIAATVQTQFWTTHQI